MDFVRLKAFEEAAQSTLHAIQGLQKSKGLATPARIALARQHGLGDEAAAPVSSLPTGSARLVELARALSTDPKVLLLDEPFSGLDEHESAALGRLLTALAAEGRAILLVEHDTDLVLEICSTVHVLDFGALLASGTPTQIRNNQRVVDAYIGTTAALA